MSQEPEAGTKEITILIADDHRIVREGLTSLLHKHPGLRVIGEAKDGQQTLSLVKELRPQVVIMDVTMPGLNGIEATRQIKQECPEVKVVGLSMHPDRQFVDGMLKAGASAYLIKSAAIREVVSAVKAAARNDMYLSKEVARNFVDIFVKDFKEEEVKILSSSRILSSREKEILQLFAEGRKRSEIAEMLFLSPRTVESHRRNIMEKLGLKSTADLVKFAIREGLTPL